MTDDITNAKLGGILSIEHVGSLLALTFMFGIGYMSLVSADESMATTVTKMEMAQGQLIDDVSEIKLNTALMKKEQAHIREHLEDQKAELKEIITLLKGR